MDFARPGPKNNWNSTTLKTLHRCRFAMSFFLWVAAMHIRQVCFRNPHKKQYHVLAKEGMANKIMAKTSKWRNTRNTCCRFLPSHRQSKDLNNERNATKELTIKKAIFSLSSPLQGGGEVKLSIYLSPPPSPSPSSFRSLPLAFFACTLTSHGQ